MSSYFIIRKLLLLCFSLLFVMTLTFFLMHSLPGDPFVQDQSIPAETLKTLHRYYGLDQPLIFQYFHYIFNIFHFDLGMSFKYINRTVSQIILESFPISLALGLEALLFSITGGLICGTIAALYRFAWQDRMILILMSLGSAIPSFILATLLQYVFAMQLDLFPVARWGDFEHTVLPSLALSLFPLTYIAKLTRTNMIDVLDQDYIVTARSKGLSRFEVIYKHVWRNALISVLVYVGPLIATIFTGSFVIEKIFGIPGLGQWLVVSIGNRDYPVIMGITIFYSFILMSSNFLVDCLLYLSDPRLKMKSAG